MMGDDRIDKGLNSHNSLPSQRIQSPTPPSGWGAVIPDDPGTWPPYLRRLHEIALTHFGLVASRRQVDAEIAFLRTADEERWQVLEDGLGGPQDRQLTEGRVGRGMEVKR